MALPSRIEGFAVVSEDGMLADSSGVMPDSLKFDADQEYFIEGMNRLDAAINGRHSKEDHPNSARRPRITVTSRVKAVVPDPASKMGILWNPAGAPFEQAWDALKLPNGSLGVVGGTSVFGLFLGRYDAFHLTRAPGVRLPGGRPVFPDVPPLTPEQIMEKHGLAPGSRETLDAAKGLTVTVWRRVRK